MADRSTEPHEHHEHHPTPPGPASSPLAVTDPQEAADVFPELPRRGAPGGALRTHPAVEDERSDEELVRLASLGDKRAFAALVDRHGPAMYRFARRMLRHDSDTEDVLQDALAAAWRALPSFRGDAAVRTWLFSITGNAVRAHQRRRRPEPVSDDVLAPLLDGLAPTGDASSGAVTSDLVAALDTALGTLPPGQRAAWLLREVEGLSYQEIADVQATTPDSVRGQLHRARSTLEQLMEAWR